MTIHRTLIHTGDASQQPSSPAHRVVHARWARGVTVFYVSIVLLGVLGITYFAHRSANADNQTVAQGRLHR